MVCRSRKPVRGEGRSRENREAVGGTESSQGRKARDESDSKCHPRYFLSPKPRDPRYRTQSPGLGEGLVRVAVPIPRTRRCGRRSRPGPGRKAGGKQAGAQSCAPRSPACRSGHPPSLAAPFPLRAGRRLLPVSPTSRARRKGHTERGKPSRGGLVVHAGRKQGGG